jgi:bile acid-coenzyme A ligase
MTTIVERIGLLARERPDAAAVTEVGRDGTTRSWSWAELVRESERAATALQERGVSPGAVVAIALRTSLEHVAACLGAWSRGAVVLPADPAMVGAEATAVLSNGGVTLVIGGGAAWEADSLAPSAWRDGPVNPAAAAYGGLDARSHQMTGGTTGESKVVERRRPWAYDAAFVAANRGVLEPDATQLVITALHHMGFQALYDGLLLGQHVLLTTHFVPSLILQTIARHRVEVMRTVPTQMKWLADSPAFADADLGSLRTLHHTAAPCPEGVKRGWIEKLGPHAVLESYSAREDLLTTYIRGDEWLRHPGSVGRPGAHAVRIVADDGREAAPGEVGAVYLRPYDGPPRYRGGEELPSHAGRFLTLGDLGYLDEDGYLHLVDRTQGMFITGGENVYPSQIELVLLDHPAVRDAAVVGRPHPQLGAVATAYVVAAGDVSADELLRHCRAALTGPRVPAAIELVGALPRTSAGKLRRARLA